MMFIHLRDHQNTAAEILWGVWLFPLAALVYKSRFLPRFLGVWLGLAGVAWVVLSLVGILLPEYQDKIDKYLQPAIIGEIVFMLWLLIMGGKPQAMDAGATAVTGRSSTASV